MVDDHSVAGLVAEVANRQQVELSHGRDAHVSGMTVGESCFARLRSPGNEDYTWVVNGSLPPGVELTFPPRRWGRVLDLVGTPTQSGEFCFDVFLYDADQVNVSHHRLRGAIETMATGG